jgi:hypothetical protein
MITHTVTAATIKERIRHRLHQLGGGRLVQAGGLWSVVGDDGGRVDARGGMSLPQLAMSLRCMSPWERIADETEVARGSPGRHRAGAVPR